MSVQRRFWILAGFALAAYAAAIAREQSLPWLLAALIGGGLLSGLLWPYLLLKRVAIRRIAPQRALEGDTVKFEFEVHNRGRLPRFMLELADHLPFVGAAELMPAAGARLLGGISYIPGGASRRFELTLQCEKRGFYRLGPVGLASSFPLGLAEVRIAGEQTTPGFTIYPKLFPIQALALLGAPSQIHRGAYCLPEGAGAAEFAGLREYRSGDNPRHVHWPTTARMNELMVKEFEPLASACLYIALDLAKDANVGRGRHSTLEYAIRIAASVAGYACRQNIHNRLLAYGAQTVGFASGKGELHFQHILDALAVVDSDGRTPYAELLTDIALHCQRGETVVLLLSEPPHRDAATLQALALLRARGANLLAVSLDRDSFFPSGAGMAAAPRRRDLTLGLLEMGVPSLTVRKGDDLTEVFNS